MIVTRMILKNWRNFLDVDVPLHENTYLLGANASGKSNFLDVFRFLRDIGKPQGGGLQKAVLDRGGIKKIRCLHARQDPVVRIELHIDDPEKAVLWKYILAFSVEPAGRRRTLVKEEVVWRGDRKILQRPDENDEADDERLTQTALEQIQANGNFRELAGFFADVTYLHLVPQLIRYEDRIRGERLEDDPFGQGFLDRIARAPEGTRRTRLKKIERALSKAVSHFSELKFAKDDTGIPHLAAKYVHFRPNAGWQQEDQFSDGTLRLIALLWILQEGNSLLLLEEPELSLNDEIVAQIPEMISRIQRTKKRRDRRQIVMSTHSSALLSNEGIDERGVLLLEPAKEGIGIRTTNAEEKMLLSNGFSIAEIVLPKTAPDEIRQLSLW